jgi:hypothetical protein
MRAALVWSYDLLSEAEQQLFRRLAVFRSSFILEAAAAVAPAVGGGILSVLGGLVDKSLVVVVDAPGGRRRFRLLEPVRQFAAELLRASGEGDDAGDRHGDHLRSRLAGSGALISGSVLQEGLGDEVDNLRGAVEHAMRGSQPEAAALILAYGEWWENLGLVDEHLDRLTAALAAADPARMSLDVRSLALQRASTRSAFVGRVDDAAAFADQLAVLRDEHPETLWVRANWAFASAMLALARAGGDRLEGNRLYHEAQDAADASGEPILAAYAAGNTVLNAILWDSVDDPEVSRALRDAARLSQTAGATNLAACGRVLGLVTRVMTGASDAYRLCLDALAELDALDGGWLATWGGLCVGVAAELVGDQTAAAAYTLLWIRFCRRSGMKIHLPFGIRGAARLSAVAGYPEQALRLWGGAGNVEAVTGMRYMPLMQRLDRPLFQQCRAALGLDTARLTAEGASWSVAEATQAAEEAILRLQGDNNGVEANSAAVAPPAG